MRRSTSLSFFLLLLLYCSFPGYAAALEITPHPGSENPVDPYQNVRLDVKGATLDDLKNSSKVLFPPAKGMTINEVATWGGEPYLLFESKSLGRYWMGLVVVVGGKLETATYTVNVGSGPDPDPDPDPDPGPVADLWSVVVGETGDWTVAHSIILNSTRLRALFNTPHHFRIFDKDLETNKSARAWISKVPANASLPYWFLIDGSNGQAVWEGKLVGSVDEAINTVRKYLPAGWTSSKASTPTNYVKVRGRSNGYYYYYYYEPVYCLPGILCP